MVSVQPKLAVNGAYTNLNGGSVGTPIYLVVEYSRSSGQIPISRNIISEGSFNYFRVVAIVCYGRPGLLKSFSTISTQICQFHQVAIMRRYITKNPKLLASIELKSIEDLLKKMNKESFEVLPEEWNSKWKEYLSEISIKNKATILRKSATKCLIKLN